MAALRFVNVTKEVMDMIEHDRYVHFAFGE